jgi:hypothetical protein
MTARSAYYAHLIAAKQHRREALQWQATRSTTEYLYSSAAREIDDYIADCWSMAHREIGRARRLRKAAGIYMIVGPDPRGRALFRPPLREALALSLAITPESETGHG